IVSEFPLGQTPTPGSFPSRNRIIAGLSLGVLVTEGAKDSGSLITADYAFKFKRPVFAIPGPITSSLSVAPLKLIEKGAKLVTSADDILKVLKIKTSTSNASKLDKAGKMVKLSKQEKNILKVLENEPLHFDEIIRALDVNASDLAITLSFLEVKGIVKQESGGYYKLL
ncbi:MAG TPA: DNA-processing protein DprA, partial [Candidatus Sulfotelmatobacter sp.]|nr:DNA-processing protein DprA [Candidatus Sulfotelmatobacter sp.]